MSRNKKNSPPAPIGGDSVSAVQAMTQGWSQANDANTLSPIELLQNFNKIADAPDAIPRLRRFILDLAVRGKLVTQDPKDEPAAELLKGLQREGQKGGIIPSKSESSPFDIPKSWLWGTVGGLLAFNYGKSLPAKDRKGGDVAVYGSNGCVGYHNVGLIEEPCIVIGRKGSAGALNLVTGLSWTTDVAYYVIPPAYFSIDFLLIALSTLDLDSLGKGVKPGLSRADAYPVPLMLPPLAEQKRIVAKVDELMALCDDLEVAQQARETQRDRLVAATHHQLNQTDTDLKEAATFTLSTFHLQTARPQDVQALRQTILNLAVRGKLVEQDPNDEPASELLKRIASEKERLIKEGKNKKPKALLPIHGVDFPHVIPNSWEWVRFGEIILDSDAGWSPKTETFPRTGDSWGVLKVSAVSWGRFQPNENKQLLPNVEPRLSAVAKLGDFLISRANTSELVAKAVVVKEAPDKLLLSDKIVRLKFPDRVSTDFAALVNNSAAHIREHYISKASGTSPSVKNVSRDVIYQVLIPLPPLAEQKRIVAKVDELMALCDQLEAQLTTTQTESQQLLEACLKEAVA